MKRLLLAMSIFMLSYAASAQIIVYIDEPANVEGNLEFTWSENWGADLLNPSNSITGELLFVTDGTADDSLGCNPLTNASAFTSVVTNVLLTNAGTGYSSASGVTTSTTGNGTGLTVDIVANPAGTVVALELTSLVGGSDYVDAQAVATTSDGAGTGLTVDITTDDGEVVDVMIVESGFGYAVGEIITIEGGNNDATIEVSEVNAGGQIISITLNNAGNGYAVGDVLTVSGGNNDATFEIANINGKIAVVYRGECEFGAKALNAQIAGAIGVIIINNISGSPVGMGAGAVGANVTIPVVMISDVAGANLKDAINAGGVIAFIGNKTNFYNYDLGIFNQHILRAPSAATNIDLAQAAGEYAFKVGAVVNNYGSLAQTGIKLSATITLNGNEVYSQTSQNFDLASGDSLFVLLPDANIANYSQGHYTLRYNISSPNPDEFPGDNELSSNYFMNDTMFTYARVNPITNILENTAGYRSTTATSNFDVCILFKSPNASRVKVKGLKFKAVTNAENSLAGEFIQTRFVQWNDPFVNIDDPAINVQLLDVLATGEYDYVEDLQGQTIYVPFDSPEGILLQNNQRYLACASTLSQNVFFGFDTSIDYFQNTEEYKEPIFITVSNTNYGLLGFGTDAVPSLALELVNLETSVNNVDQNSEITPYPNPAADRLFIPFGSDKKGMADLMVFDITGKLVLTERVNVTNQNIKTMETGSLENGSYLFQVTYADGSKSSFKVLISR